MASEGQITVLNLRTPQWPPYDFELFVEGDLCAVHKGTERGRAYRFQAPNVVTLGVPRQGMRIRKGSAFDSEVELEERRVNLDLTMLKQGDQLCWLTLGTNEELDLFWQSELVKIDIEPARV